MNRLVLSATLVERGARRSTPAGVPVLELKLLHESDLSEDGQMRRVSMEIKALAIGAITAPVGALSLGTPATFAGFLTNARNGRGVLFHITSLN
jgi:primosomal replication protein N